MTRTAYTRCPECRFHPVSSTRSGPIQLDRGGPGDRHDLWKIELRKVS
jgi:hypothetical protein